MYTNRPLTRTPFFNNFRKDEREGNRPREHTEDADDESPTNDKDKENANGSTEIDQD